VAAAAALALSSTLNVSDIHRVLTLSSLSKHADLVHYLRFVAVMFVLLVNLFLERCRRTQARWTAPCNLRAGPLVLNHPKLPNNAVQKTTRHVHLRMA